MEVSTEEKADVFVVSLKSSTDRRDIFTRRALDSTVTWKFFDAHRTLTPPLTYDEKQSFIHSGYALTDSERACYSSHYGVWQEIVEKDIPQAVIVEDDAVIDWNFIPKLFSENLTGQGIDYLKLVNTRPVKFRIVQEPFLDKVLVNFSGYAFGTVAYFVTNRGARIFLEKLKHVRRPIDRAMDRDWHHGLRNLAIFPPVAFEATGASTIGGARRIRQAVPRELAFARFRARAAEKLNRMIYTRSL